MDCTFVIPRDLTGPSGGNHYNAAMVSALREAGHQVHVQPVPGQWPAPTDEDLRELEAVLSGPAPVVADGIVALTAPETLERASRRGAAVHVLVHSLLSAASGLGGEETRRLRRLEGAALTAAASAISPSRWSALDVARRHPGIVAHVVQPGTTEAPIAAGSRPPQFLVLAALTPLKNQFTVLEALSHLTDLAWTLQLVGPDSVDAEYAEKLRSFAASAFAPGRVTFRGALVGETLARCWEATDLLLLTSTSETFGMVVTEALARGIPAVVPEGTGAVEALLGPPGQAGPRPPGAVVDPLDADGLAGTLRHWLEDPVVRAAWRQAAIARRPELRTWQTAAAELARVIESWERREQ